MIIQEQIAILNLFNNMCGVKCNGVKFTQSEHNVYRNLAAAISARSRYLRDVHNEMVRAHEAERAKGQDSL